MAFLMQVSFKFRSSVSPTRCLIVAAKDYFEGRGKSHIGDYVGWLTCGMWCWLRIAAEVGSSVLVQCGEFFLHQTAMLLYVWGNVHHMDCLGYVNKNAGYSLALWIVCTMYNTFLIKKSDKHHLYLVTDLAFFLGLWQWCFSVWWVLFSSVIKHIVKVLLTGEYLRWIRKWVKCHCFATKFWSHSDIMQTLCIQIWNWCSVLGVM